MLFESKNMGTLEDFSAKAKAASTQLNITDQSGFPVKPGGYHIYGSNNNPGFVMEQRMASTTNTTHELSKPIFIAAAQDLGLSDRVIERIQKQPDNWPAPINLDI